MATPRSRAMRVACLLLGGLLLTCVSCGGDASAPTPTPAPASTPTPVPPSATATQPPATAAPDPATPTQESAATLEDGMLVSVGDHALWIRCWGEGSPTIVFEAPGPAEDSSALGALPQEASTFTRVCVYDRAGQGQSEPGGPTPTTAAQQAAELATLLENAGVTGPRIAAGYSWGGTLAYLLATAQPDAIAGVVLIDTPNDEALAAIAATQQVVDNVDFAASADELAAATPLGDTPLLVITRGLPPGPGADDFPTWQAQQAAWLERSTISHQVIAAQSDHFDILETDLEVVVAAIEELVLSLRS